MELIKNEIKSFELYKKAVEKGDINSIIDLGICYLCGIGTVTNEVKAFELVKKQLKEVILLQKSVGICHQNGIGIEENENKAFELYKEIS